MVGRINPSVFSSQPNRKRGNRHAFTRHFLLCTAPRPPINHTSVWRRVLENLPKALLREFSGGFAEGSEYWAKYFFTELSVSSGLCSLVSRVTKLGLDADKMDRCIWMMNDRMLAGIPGWCAKAVGRQYYRSFQRKAAAHVQRRTLYKSHPLDWQIAYRAISGEAFEIDILACPFVRLSKEFGVPGLLPGICRMDYLFANRMGNGFVRTKTLGDGDGCCNCHYEMTGNCAWAPKTGFITRK